MAYKEKYYKEIESRGHTWLLRISQDTEDSFTATEIGAVLQGLRLTVQGDQSGVDTGVVKTSLEMVFVDAPDLEDGRKNGDWEEFYTSSATEYLVELFKDGMLEWGGYITPDSFEEDLRYRGSVTLVARDNLGSLQNYDCDLTGVQTFAEKVRVWDIIDQAMRVCSMRMQVIYDVDKLPKAVGTEGRTTGSNGILEQMIDTRALSEMNWYDALEKTLYSLGLVLRYIGGGQMLLSALKDMPKMNQEYWWDIPVRDVIFEAYGHRELAPAVKDITEASEFDVDSESSPYEPSEYKEEGSYTPVNLGFWYPDGSFNNNVTAPVHGYQNERVGGIVSEGDSGLLDVSRYERVAGEDSEEYGSWDDRSIYYYALNVEKKLAFKCAVFGTGAVTFGLTLAKPVSVTADGAGVLNTPNKPLSANDSWGDSGYLVYRLIHTDETGNVLYYNGSSWQTAAYNRTYTIGDTTIFTSDKPGVQEFKLEGITPPSAGVLSFEIQRIYEVLSISVRQPVKGMYMRIKDVKFTQEVDSADIVTKTKLTTKLSEKNSIRLTREPEFSICPSFAPEVGYVRNAILMEKTKYGYEGAQQWAFAKVDEDSTVPESEQLAAMTGISLSRLIHQQLIGYYSKPNSILTGSLVDVAGDIPNFRSLWRWSGKDHLLMSGSLNILTGRMENAVLREFARYDRIWETWVEQEDYILEGTSSINVNVWVNANKKITEDMFSSPASWIRVLRVSSATTGRQLISLRVDGNTTGETRSAIVMIDTAAVRITQKMPRDYSADYSEDYN